MTEVAAEVFGEALTTAQQYHDLLATQGVEWGLIGPREVERLWERHLLNSVAITGLVPSGAEVIDIGSGAGLPGIPLALVRPDCRVTLLEPLLRRFNFLSSVVDELGLEDRVAVERGRAEDFEGSFDVVTSRAVAPLTKLIPWCRPLVVAGGAVLAIKGASAADEVATAGALLAKEQLTAEVLSVRASARSEPTTVVRIRSRHA